MRDLFASSHQRILLPPGKSDLTSGGELDYYPDFLTTAEADSLFDTFRHQVDWRQDSIRIAGRQIPIPRLNAWYGDPGSRYRYSGIQLEPIGWSDDLLVLKQTVERAAGCPFNSALINLYRDGQDSVSWHSDDEPELGRYPVIASVSLGVTRKFQLKAKKGTAEKRAKRFELELSHGSLLVMAGETQHRWHHQVPKEPLVTGERINITFRRVQPQ